MKTNGHEESLFYRLIKKSEWDRLTPIFQEIKKFMPDRELAIASIAETAEGEIAAMVALQMVSYIGPLYANPRFAGKWSPRSLIAPIDEVYSKNNNKPLIIQGYVALCDDESVAKLAEMAGMIRKPATIVLVKEYGEEHRLSM